MNAFYNRDLNISGVTPITSLNYSPSYGSRVAFSSLSNNYETQNGYYNSIPLSINSLNAEYQLRFDVNETDAQKIVYFIEDSSGINLFTFTDPSQIYKTISGVSDSYSINHVNKNHYEVAVSFSVNEAPNLFNWSGMNFVNNTFANWISGNSYEKYDIIYSGVSKNKLNNYYYCSGDHAASSESLDGPTGTDSKWSQYFFFEPDVGLQNDVSLKVDKIEFKNSFIQRIKNRKNIAQTEFSYKFSSASTKKTKAILHFLENKGGYRRFYSEPPSVYNQTKVFYSPSWNHSWKFTDSHDLDVSLVEDPLGIVPTGS
jgi:phage-related protein